MCFNRKCMKKVCVWLVERLDFPSSSIIIYSSIYYSYVRNYLFLQERYEITWPNTKYPFCKYYEPNTKCKGHWNNTQTSPQHPPHYTYTQMHYKGLKWTKYIILFSWRAPCNISSWNYFEDNILKIPHRLTNTIMPLKRKNNVDIHMPFFRT